MHRFRKVKRGYWTTRQDTSNCNYLTIHLHTDYTTRDGKSVWTYGWHIQRRRRDGWLLERVACYGTRALAEAAAQSIQI